MFTLKIITPKKVVREQEISGLSIPTPRGEITILPKHQPLFSLLVEGIVKIIMGEKEEFLAVGGGYAETDGKQVHLLVSRAYGQDEIDEKLTEKALISAKQILKDTKDQKIQSEAAITVRRSVIDLKLLKKKKQRTI